MLDLSVGRQTTQNMNLRASKAKETTPFKAGKIKYDAPKYLSSAMTPPRKRKEIRSTSSASLYKKSQDRPSQEDPIQEESFEPTPISAKYQRHSIRTDPRLFRNNIHREQR